ncbi:MAG: stage V sporulation protein AD [Clostridiales bacterium]|nr:stage V sporulation protein AD [Clostridiales bacterium]
MPERIGKNTLLLTSNPSVIGFAGVGGITEGEGPLSEEFDYLFDDDEAGQSSFEKAESLFHKEAVERALSKAGKSKSDVDYIFAGDLLNQCTGSTFGIRNMNIPYIGVYGACSTMALTLSLASIFVDSGAANCAVASTSSHFCSAERQFRLPLEYGGQRTPTAQHTATAAGASVISSHVKNTPCVSAVLIGKIRDLGIKDANNMGAAMAPAAAQTISDFLSDTNTKPEDYDLILTGDLGKVGSALLKELTEKDFGVDISSVHNDCGLLIYDMENQDVHAGGSGCGCSASVVNTHVMNNLKNGKLGKVLFVATGALLSATSTLQGETIPSIAHAVLLTCGERE